jgi:hypothetical protein
VGSVTRLASCGRSLQHDSLSTVKGSKIICMSPAMVGANHARKRALTALSDVDFPGVH